MTFSAGQAAKELNVMIGILGSRKPKIACDHSLPPMNLISS